MLQEFVDQVNKTAQKTVEGIHTAIPGEITKFDPSTCKATVQPKAKFKKPDGSSIDFPTITGVPVMFPRSGDVTVAWPVKAGDGCLIVFAEGALDYWMYGKETDTVLKFDLSNAIAIPNVKPEGSGVMQEACNEDAVVVQNKGTKLKVKADGVYIVGNLTVTGGIVNLN